MLTARAEYRLRLRADNAPTRLSTLAERAGALSAERAEWVASMRSQRSAIADLLTQVATCEGVNGVCKTHYRDGLKRSLAEWLRFPDVSVDSVLTLEPRLQEYDRSVVEEAAGDAHYAPYVARQDDEIARLKADENIRIPSALDYGAVPGLSNEMVEKLSVSRPATLGAASRMRGITPAALAAILVHAKRKAA
jgi:tRNA uridine 5-carboxymethylaminomethyl modification enzyme